MAALMAVIPVLAWSQNDPFVIKTTNGPVRGFDEEGTMAFKGIPYAKVERCMPPAPVEKWDDVLDCTEWGPQSFQSGRIQPGSAEKVAQANKFNLSKNADEAQMRAVEEFVIKSSEGNTYKILSQVVSMLNQIIRICEYAIDNPKDYPNTYYWDELKYKAEIGILLTKQNPIWDTEAL